MAADKRVTHRYHPCFRKKDRAIAGCVPGQQNGIRLAGEAPQRVGGPGLGAGCRLSFEGSRLDGVRHPAEDAGPPGADDDLA